MVTEDGRLQKPLLDMHVNEVNTDIKYVKTVTTLPDGGCVVFNVNDTEVKANEGQVLRLDRYGKTIRPWYECKDVITGILHSSGMVFVIGRDGTISKHSLSDLSKVIQTYKLNAASLYPGDIIDEQRLILVDDKRAEVFTYSMTTNVKNVKIRGLTSPVDVVYGKDLSLFAVCERDDHQVSLYNESWTLQQRIDFRRDGQMLDPRSCLFTPWGTLLVCDSNNNRISEYYIPNGTLREHIIADIDSPVSMSYSHYCLWITHGDPEGQLKRYILV